MPPTINRLNSLKENITEAAGQVKKKGKLKFLLIPLMVLAGFFLVLALLLIPPFFSIRSSATTLKTRLDDVKNAASTKDLNLLSQKLAETKSAASDLEGDIKKISWVGRLPLVGPYAKDAQNASQAVTASIEAGEIVIQTIAPYADIIGLSAGEVATDSAKTAQDRITFVVETVDKIAPQLDPIGEKLSIASEKLNAIDPDRYPEEMKGTKIRSNLLEAQTLVSQAATLSKDAKPLLEAAPYILGIDGKRTYLAIFQNDAELRPTGGFMTAYAILEVQKGKVKPLFSDDIYALDAKYNPTLRAPDALIKYISFPYQKDPRWRIRDMNIAPDFRATMETFLAEYQKTGSPKVDGVISVDTQLLLDLLKVTGPIGVPGQGNYSAELDKRCNCPVVIYELESVISVETPFIRDYRKAVLGPLMNSILANAVAQPKEKIGDLFQVILENIQEKHLMLYYTDEKIQGAVESFNLAGRVRAYDGDYQYLVGSNFAGAKSNMYLETHVEDEISLEGDSAVHNLSVEFTNPQKYDGWLNGENRNWFRLYVPKGSTMVDSTGSEVKIETYEEFDKTVFAGFITVRPGGGVSRFTINYKTPTVLKNGKYSLLIQKQPGTKNDPYFITVNGQEYEFELNADREIN